MKLNFIKRQCVTCSGRCCAKDRVALLWAVGSVLWLTPTHLRV
jgi:hypothetical protein